MTRCSVLVCAAILLAWSASSDAYLQFAVDVNGRTTPLRWKDTPVRWYATEQGAANVSATAFQAAVSRAFDTWQNVPTASISFSFAGFTAAAPFDEDGISVLGFVDRSEPEFERVLGATSFVIDDVTGEIVESDIFFNSAFQWSTSDAGQSGRFDLQSVATHEIGHFLGLGHSAIGETEPRSSGGRRVLASSAVMFPISFGTVNTADRTLQPDDIAGASDLYPDGDFKQRTGSLVGRVLLNGRPILGAHVMAFHLETGEFVGGFTLNDAGEFQIAGLKPGAHVIRVEPLDDADVDSFLEPDGIEIGFRPTFYSRLVGVPAGGTAPRFDVAVFPK
jgi:hypothetical protein